jgi:hypothetical protein
MGDGKGAGRKTVKRSDETQIGYPYSSSLSLKRGLI